MTTNPSLAAKENKDFFAVVKEILLDIRSCVGCLHRYAGFDEARQLAQIRENVIIKIPMTKEGIKCLPILSKEGIKTNVTLIFSQNQALLEARAGATYVSPFVGRLDDLGFDGISLVQDIVEMFKFYQLPTKVIAASIRHPLHVVEAVKIGADIATIPYKVFQQMFEHPLTASGVEKFMRDWQERVK